MKKIYTLLIVLFIVNSTLAQSCLPDGITFTTQAQIDSFQIIYPNCTEIEGDVLIGGLSSDIINLNGLNVLTSIGGSLTIYWNPSLTSLSGLDNVTTIGGCLSIYENNTLSSFSGLDNVTSIGGCIDILYNDALTSLSGLEGLTSIGESLYIMWNEALTSLTGLDNVTSIGGSIVIGANDVLSSLTGLEGLNIINGDLIVGEYEGGEGGDNPALTSLAGLDNVTSIGGYVYIKGNSVLSNMIGLDNVTSIEGGLYIDDNDALTSLTGLDNIDAGSILNISIYDNWNLSTCDVQSICDYLASPNGTINIYDNAMGCNSPPEIANACGITIPCLPFGNYHFNSQNEIDEFAINYPNCTILEGNIYISGDDITNLNGLNVVTSIGGYLSIQGNDALTSLSGLDNVTSIGGDFKIIGNDVLTSLTGLDNLTSIGGTLNIGYPYYLQPPIGNPSLTNLSGLENLTSIGGGLYVGGNAILTSLTGLDNLKAESIEGLLIKDNPYLSHCSVLSICNFLSNSNGTIDENTTGCNSPEEVQDSCEANAVSIDEKNIINRLVIYPNPSSTQITIELPLAPQKNTSLSIYNTSGQHLITQPITEPQTVVDITGLPKGVYFVKVVDDEKVMMGKVIKQ